MFTFKLLTSLHLQGLPRMQLYQLWELAPDVLSYQCNHDLSYMDMAVLVVPGLRVSVKECIY